jgi:hypothetical protein
MAQATIPPANNAAAQDQYPQQPAQPPADQIIAKVNDRVITQRELEESVRVHQQANPEVAQQAGGRGLRTQALQSLIDGALVEDYMREKGPDVSKQEVETVVGQIKQQVEASGVSYDQFLQERGQSESELENRLTGSLAWQKYQQQELTEPKLREHYDRNKQHFAGQNFDQAKPVVAQSMVASLWTQVVAQARPDAKIEVVDQAAAGDPAAQPQGSYPAQ